MLTRRESTGKRRRFILSWGLLAVAGLVAGLVGLATHSGSADGQDAPLATPVNLAVSGITETGATFTWEAGAGGGCAATHYFVMHYDADGLRLSSVRIATLSRSVTGLTPGTEYSFSVAADGECGFSSYAPRKSFTTLGAAPKTLYPNKPSGLSVSSITDTTAVLSWTAGADGDCATTAHDVWVELNYGEALWERQGVTGTTVTVTGLSAGTTYTAYVDSYGSTCDESSDFVKERFTTSTVVATNTPTPEPTTTVRPNAPTGLAASSITETGTTLSWTAGADGGCATTSYTIDVDLDVSGRPVSGQPAETNAWEARREVWTRTEVAATTVTVTGLSRATVYTVDVAAYGTSCSHYSLEATIRFTTTGDPAKPSGVMATGGVRQATLAWTDLSDTTVRRWEYRQKAGAGSYGSWTTMSGSSATTTRHTVTGLAGGTTYAFQVRAVNPAGNSPASDEITAATAPAKPTSVTATGGARQVALGWADPGYASITSWEYQQKQGSGAYGSWTAIGSSSATTTSHTVTGLSDGTTYAFKVRAVNASGNGDASDEVTAATIPAKPTGLTATGGVRAAALSWTNPGGATITRWEYQQKAGTGNYGAWTAIPSSSATTTGYTVTGLTAGTVYAFKVRAVNSAGNGPASDEATAATAPAKPTGVTATAGAQRVILAWADPGDATITRWEYQQKQGTGAYGSWTVIPGSSATTTTYTVRGLLAETTYGFKVRAVNPAGNGPASDEATATTPMFVLVPEEETPTPTTTPTPTPTGTPMPTPTATPTATPTPPPAATSTPTPPPGATPAPGSTATPTPPPGDAPDTGAGDTDDDEPTEPDIGAGDRADDEPGAPDTGAGDDVADDEPDIGAAGSGLATGASVSLAAITPVIALALALSGSAWARRRR